MPGVFGFPPGVFLPRFPLPRPGRSLEDGVGGLESPPCCSRGAALWRLSPGREWLRERLPAEEDGGAESGSRLLSLERDLSLEGPPW